MNYASVIVYVIVELAIFGITSAADDEKNLSKHPAWKHFDEENCGESYSDRIIGGVEANLGQYPWIARIGYEKTPRDISYDCGGVLITNRYVLTAAHCAEDIIAVKLGDHDISKDVDCKNGICAAPTQDFKPEKVIVHDHYNNPKFAHDIALIRLDREVNLNGWVSPICVYRNPNEDAKAKEITEAAGWGYTSMKTMNTATKLKTVNLPVVDRKECAKIFKDTVDINRGQVCAGGIIKEDACGGDSGGPLMKADDINGTPKMYLLGVVSFGPTLCGNAIPGIYTSVPYYTEWILNNL